MSRECSLHGRQYAKKIDKINDRLIQRSVSCESYRSIAEEFGVSESSLLRHATNCIAEQISKAKDIADTIGGESLKCRLRAHRDKIEDCFGRALAADNLRDCHNFITDGLAEMKFEAELEGKIAAQAQINVSLQQVNIYDSPEWLAVGSVLAHILEPYPEIRMEVAKALLTLTEVHRA